MLDTTLPSDVWSVILDFLKISDLPGLISVNKEIRSIVDADHVYERYAKRKYPPNLCILVEKYNNSWKCLLKDDNAENGVYRRNIMAISNWRWNGRIYMREYVNAIRSMTWDRKSNKILLDIEGFGNTDLRAARTTSIFRVNPIPVPPRAILIPPEATEEYPHNSTSHNLCRQYYSADMFRSGHSYKFTYSGSPTIRGSDYECVTFLHKEDFQLDLKKLFDVSSWEDCEFVSREEGLKLVPSKVEEWPGVELPDPVRLLHEQRQWGAVLPANIYSS